MLNLLQLAVCYFLAGVFLAAGAAKVTDLASFRDRLELHSGYPLWLARSVAYFLPWLELILGWCLVVGYARREALLLAALLLVAFIAHALIQRSNSSDCGCLILPASWHFANEGPWMLVRNVVLLAGAVWVLIGKAGSDGRARWGRTPPPTPPLKGEGSRS